MCTGFEEVMGKRWERDKKKKGKPVICAVIHDDAARTTQVVLSEVRVVEEMNESR